MHNTFGSHESRMPSFCSTEKYFINNYVPQQRVTPGNASYASATKFKNKKVCIIGDSRLKRINKGQSEKNIGKILSLFKCFSATNIKQLNYYTVPTLVDETPETVVT